MKYLTKDWYLRCQTWPMPQELLDEINDTLKTYRAVQEAEPLPEGLLESFRFHDFEVLSGSQSEPGADLLLRLGEPGYESRLLTFRNAFVKGTLPPPDSTLIYWELYRHKSGCGLEVHLLFHHWKKGAKKVTAEQLFDPVIRCEELLIEE